MTKDILSVEQRQTSVAANRWQAIRGGAGMTFNLSMAAIVSAQVFLVCMLTGCSCRQDRPPETSDGQVSTDMPQDVVEPELIQLVSLGSGVYRIKLDAQRRVVSLVVVEQTIVWDVFGENDAMEIATRRAKLKAVKTFSAWLSAQVSTEHNVYRSAHRISEASFAKLRLLHENIDKETNTLTLVFGYMRESSAEKGDKAKMLLFEEVSEESTSSNDMISTGAFLLNGVRLEETKTRKAAVSETMCGHHREWYENGARCIEAVSDQEERLSVTGWYESGEKAGELVMDQRGTSITRYHRNGGVAEKLQRIGDERPKLVGRWDEEGKPIELGLRPQS